MARKKDPSEKVPSATNQAKRVLDLLKRFNDGETIVIDQLLLYDDLWKNSRNESVCKKTITRALDVIDEYYPGSYTSLPNGVCKGNSLKVFGNLLDSKSLSLAVLIYELVKNSGVESSLSQETIKIIEQRKKEANKCYEFLIRPFEEFRKKGMIINDLEIAIKNARKISASYKAKETKKYDSINPYKMIFINENLYLVSEMDGRSLFLRVSNIKEVKISPHTFHKNLDFVEFLKNIQTPFSSYDENNKKLIKVLIKINNKKAKFFQNKKFLKSQSIEETLENGDIVVRYMITNFNEITSFILGWLPNVEVLEPKKLKDEINQMLKNARV